MVCAGIYRLDRLTSGVTIFAKTQPKCRQLMAAIRDRHVEKTYLCRVAGEFPRLVADFYFLIFFEVAYFYFLFFYKLASIGCVFAVVS